MFVGRKSELDSLNKLYRKKGFCMTVVYGRRRIGKSTLITEFIKDKPSIFYTAAKVGAERNLELFSEQVLYALNSDLKDISFKTLDAVFDFIGNHLTERKLILVIDELPYWAEKDEGMLSVIQKYIDTRWADKQLMLILCGSSLSYMESKVLSEKSPVFGRRDSQIKLEAFSYEEAALFVPDYSYEDKAICYGITGGVAKYLSLIDPQKSLDDNIKKLFFHPDGYLYDEPRNLLTQEFTDTSLVNNIIEQIAAGQNTVSGIAAKLKEKDPKILYFIEKLINVGLVAKKKCITEETNRKKVQYVLKDSMFKFWYAFIPRVNSIIELGSGDLYYDRIVKERLHDFMGTVFEDMCRHYTLKTGINGCFGNFITRTGSWWGMEQIKAPDGTKRSQPADIDVVGISDLDKTMVIGECKFRNEKVDKDVYDLLVRRAGILSGKYKITHLLIFSLSGFTKWFETIPKDQLSCLTLKDLYIT